MYPEIHIFNSGISTYFLCAVIGFIVCYLLLSSLLLKKYIFRKYIGAYLLSCIGMLLGAKLFGFISRLLSVYHCAGVWKFAYCLKNSGIVYLGGLLGYLIMLKILCIFKNRNWNEISNITTVTIPLFHSFGRIGCFLGGCCYGIKSNSHIAFPYRIVLKDGQWTPRIPIQLMESFFEFILFLVFYFWYRKKSDKQKYDDNQMLDFYLLLYSMWRFIIEFWRGDSERGKFGCFSFSQIISVFIFVFASINILKKRRKLRCKS